ncbi:MAG: acyl-CoA synthetase FdrA, partial [Nitrososphaeraceae archaeon]
MTTTKTLIKNNTFYDSLTLMRISKNASELKEIIQAVTVMGSEINKRMLDDVGLLTDNIKHATTNDVIISVSGKTNSAVESALEAIEKMLVDVNPPRITESVPRTIEAALERLPDANLALISVPGPFAKLEAEKALKRGLNVMLFSDGVSIADELELKKEAEKKDLLMMGPGCGTAIINGIGLGFANVVQKGQVGIVGAAGTGIQQVTTLIHQKGYGISNAIGTGGRDLSNDIGGIMMHKGIKILENDNDTKVIVLISKSPDPKIERTILEKSYSKPVIFCFIGGEAPESSRTINAPIIVTVHTLEEAAIAAIALVKKEKWSKIIFSRPMEEVMTIAER